MSLAQVRYCSESCQKQDWKAHKIFCALHPFQSAPGMERSVQAVLLPENDKAPCVVQVPLKEFHHDGMTHFLPDVTPFLGDMMTGDIRSDFLPQQPFAHLRHTLHLNFRDAFMMDGSEENACIAKLLSNEFPACMWRGPVLVMKSKGGQMDPHYVDMKMQDTRDIVEFIHQYGLASLSR